jgi:hypothetical protein
VKKVHRWLWRYPKLWIIDKMMIQLLTTSARENNFEDWGEENLLLAVERGVQYVEDPPVSVRMFPPPLVLSHTTTH